MLEDISQNEGTEKSDYTSVINGTDLSSHIGRFIPDSIMILM